MSEIGKLEKTAWRLLEETKVLEQLRQIGEPTASDEAVQRCRDMQDTQMMPYFLHIRGRKGRSSGTG
jgi:hypothetical protein